MLLFATSFTRMSKCTRKHTLSIAQASHNRPAIESSPPSESSLTDGDSSPPVSVDQWISSSLQGVLRVPARRFTTVQADHTSRRPGLGSAEPAGAGEPSTSHTPHTELGQR